MVKVGVLARVDGRRRRRPRLRQGRQARQGIDDLCRAMPNATGCCLLDGCPLSLQRVALVTDSSHRRGAELLSWQDTRKIIRTQVLLDSGTPGDAVHGSPTAQTNPRAPVYHLCQRKLPRRL